VTRETSIGWAQTTWNPATGCNRHCEYCYAREMHHRFKDVWGYDFQPTFHPDRLRLPYTWKKPRIVFVCSMGELFDLPMDQVEKVLTVCSENPKHRFLLLSKREDMLRHYSYPGNVWLGVTVTGAIDEHRIKALLDTDAHIKFISFEPLLDSTSEDLDLHGVDWVIIGGRRKVVWPDPIPKFVPPRCWVTPLIEKAREAGCAVFLKDNLEWPETVREWPIDLAGDLNE